jgi:hypothetical protein
MAAITSNGTGGGNASAGASWSGGVAPVDGDTITIAATDTITQDVNRIYGSKAGAVGHAVTINGTSSSTFGTFKVNAGVTLTLRGFDTASNTMMLVNQFAQFNPQPGSTIVGDVAGNYSSIILCKGQLNALGTVGNPITFTSPSANNSWANAAAAEAWNAVSGAGWLYDPPNLRACASFANAPIANSGGTGIGSPGDTSLTFGGTDAGSFTSEVSSIGAVVSAGQYYVDYQQGYVYFHRDNTGSQPNFTKTYKYLTITQGWGISVAQNTSYNSAVFDHCVFNYMGSTTLDTWGLNIQNKLSALANSGNSDRLFKLTNSTIQYCANVVSLKACNGTSGDPLLLTGNTIYTNNSAINCYRSSSTYVKVDSNTMSAGIALTWDGTPGGVVACSGWMVSNNTFTTSLMLGGSHTLGCTMPGTTFSGNTVNGTGQAKDSRVIAGVSGGAGNALTFSGNAFILNKRTLHHGSYMVFTGNTLYFSMHHGCVGSIDDDIQITNIRINNNLFYGESTAYNSSPSMESGYNHRQWLDDIQVVNNTSVGARGGIFGFGDIQDNSTFCACTRLYVANNLGRMVTAGTSNAFQRRGLSAGVAVWRGHVPRWDYNLDYNYNTRYSGLSNQGTFTLSGNPYNDVPSPSRNLPGVALFDPSFGTKSGGTLAFTYSSATNQTLAWGAGSAVQLVFGSGTATAGANAGNGLSGTLTDGGQAWNTTLGNAASPSLNWVKITGGTGSGQVRMITNNTATVLTVVPKWTTPPDATSTYAIIQPEVTLVDGAESVHAGIYLPDLPTTSGTDTGIGFADHSVTGSNPLLISASGTTVDSYKWTSGSPAQDAGTDTIAPATDYYGTTRPQLAHADLGFFELAGTAWPWFTDYELTGRMNHLGM